MSDTEDLFTSMWGADTAPAVPFGLFYQSVSTWFALSSSIIIWQMLLHRQNANILKKAVTHNFKMLSRHSLATLLKTMNHVTY